MRIPHNTCALGFIAFNRLIISSFTQRYLERTVQYEDFKAGLTGINIDLGKRCCCRYF